MLNKFINRGNDFLGTKFPIIGGAMTWVSNSILVAAISNAGGFGVLASGSMSLETLKKEIESTISLVGSHLFGVNLITMHPQLEEMIKICIELKVQYIVFAGSVALIKRDLIAILKQNNIKILCFAPSLIIAKGLIRMGIDALILEGNEAGGHIGPVSTMVLAQEILPHIIEVPIFIGGGIGNGAAIAAFLKMGAAGVQIGTKFVCAFESPAHKNFKEIFIKSQSRDALSSVQLSPDFQVIPVRAIKNKASENFMAFQMTILDEFKQGLVAKEEAQLNIEKFWVGSLKRAVVDGDIENGSLMAGQSVGMVKKEESVIDIINELIIQTKNYLI